MSDNIPAAVVGYAESADFLEEAASHAAGEAHFQVMAAAPRVKAAVTYLLELDDYHEGEQERRGDCWAMGDGEGSRPTSRSWRRRRG